MLQKKYQPALRKGIKIAVDLQAKRGNSEEDKQGVKVGVDIAPNNFILDFIIEMYNLVVDTGFKRSLLQIIGENKTAVADKIIMAAGNSNKNETLDLARLVTATNATELEALIKAVGNNNINKIKQSGIVPVMGLTHIGLLPNMITAIGGSINLETLKEVIAYRHPGQGDLAEALSMEAAGNINTFSRLCEEVPKFLETSPPSGLLDNVQTVIDQYNIAVGNYNNSDILVGFNAELTLFYNNAELVYEQAKNSTIINGKFLQNIQIKMDMFNRDVMAVDINSVADKDNYILSAKKLADGLNSILRNVEKQIKNGIENTDLSFDLDKFDNAFATMTTSCNKALEMNKASIIEGVSFSHFLVRHTAHYFNFSDIKDNNTQWNTNWGSSSNNNVSTQFISVMKNLINQKDWLEPNKHKGSQSVPTGGTAQIAAKKGSSNDKIIIGQFFPHDQPSADQYPHSESTMIAINELI